MSLSASIATECRWTNGQQDDGRAEQALSTFREATRRADCRRRDHNSRQYFMKSRNEDSMTTMRRGFDEDRTHHPECEDSPHR